MENKAPSLRRVFSLSHQEVIENSFDKQVWVEREVVLKGGSLIPCPKEPNIPTPKPDMLVYMVSNYAFKDRDDAYRFCEYINSKAEFIYDLEKDYKHNCSFVGGKLGHRGWDMPSVSEQSVYSEERYYSLIEEISLAEKSKKEFKEMKVTWEENQKIAEKVAPFVWRFFTLHESIESKYIQFMALYDRYLALADNNHEIAIRFLKNEKFIIFGICLRAWDVLAGIWNERNAVQDTSGDFIAIPCEDVSPEEFVLDDSQISEYLKDNGSHDE